MTNTLGAVTGSVLALAVPRSMRGMAPKPDAALPRPVTRGRRAVAMLCDALGYGFVVSSAGVATQIWLQYVIQDRQALLDGRIAGILGVTVASGLWLGIILATGRSVGDLAVQLRYRGSRMPRPLARALRWAGGIGGIGLLQPLGGVFDALFSALILLAIVLLFTTRRGRGLPGLLSRQELEDARSGVATDAAASDPR